jgi:hypothetical protein
MHITPQQAILQVPEKSEVLVLSLATTIGLQGCIPEKEEDHP